jgi:HEAT repeat protein
MSGLAVAFTAVGCLLLLNLLTAVGVRAAGNRRARRARRLEPEIRRAVSDFSMELREDLPQPRSRHERRLLEEALLETATEVSGTAHERLAESFVALGFADRAVADLRSRFAMRRVHAAEALGQMRVREAAGALRAGLRDRDPLVRFACANALTRVGAHGVLRPIIAALTSDRHGSTTGEVVETLLDYGRPAAAELIELLAAERDPEVSLVMVVALGELRSVDAVPELVRCLRDPDPELAARAAHALGKVGDPRSAAELAAQATGAEAWEVRAAACGACGHVAAPETPRALALALDDPSWHVRSAAARALVRLEDRGLAAVRVRLAALGRTGLLQLWGAFELADRSAAAIEAAAAGDRDADALVRATLAAGARARLEEVAERDDAAGRYARELLEETEQAAVTAGERR